MLGLGVTDVEQGRGGHRDHRLCSLPRCGGAPQSEVSRGNSGQSAEALHIREELLDTPASRGGMNNIVSLFYISFLQIFQTYYYGKAWDVDPNLREMFSSSPHFQDCIKFCRDYDQTSFDPDYDSLTPEE